MQGQRGWVWGGLGLLCVPLAGCSLNASGVGTSAAASIGGPDDDGGTTSGGTDGDAPGAPDSTSDVADAGGTFGVDTTGADGSSTGEPPPATGDGEPLLALSDGPTFDFGAIDVGNQLVHSFTLTNNGDALATGIDGASLADPFAFTGAFPGAAGTCGSSLPAGDGCTIEVRFTPGQIGPHAGTLSIVSDGPSVDREMMGGGAGRSDNLIANPGGESTGSPPPSWTNAGAGNWMAGNWGAGFPTPTGNNYLTATDGPNDQDYVLRQDVSLEAWAALSDLGVLRLSFQGEARSLQDDNDSHRIRVRYRDAGGAVLDTWDTSWQGTGTWTLRSDERIAPAGTRSVRVDLMCRKTFGAYCDGYFDELELRASYP